MAIVVKFHGALTFENDDEMAEALAEAEQHSKEHPNLLLTMDEIEQLGLHITVNHTAQGDEAQLENSQTLIHRLVAQAYSGYIDITVDGIQRRFHAKEIEPKHVQLTDIVD
jgi:hypothetical protein